MASARIPSLLLASLALLATGGAAAEAARAQAQPERVWLSYEAPSQCPSAAQLMDSVALRASVDWSTELNDSVRHLEVRVEPTGATYTARLQYLDTDDRRVTRSVEAPSCEQAVSAIGLVIALTIEERATPAETAEPKPLEPPPAPVPTHATAPRRDNVAPPNPIPSKINQELGAIAGASYGIGPGAAFGAGAWWGIGRAPFPLLRVVGRWQEHHSNTASAPGVESRFRLISGTPQACAGQRLPALANGVVALCAGIELGQYRAQALTAGARYRALSNSLFWASAEVSAALRLASGAIFAQFQPMVRFPLVSGHFSVIDSGNRETLIHRIPRVAPGLEIGLGVTF